MKKIAVLFCFFLTTPSLALQQVDLIIFSFDRPLQLYALLESVEKHVQNVGDVQVIYRSSNERYECAYQNVFKRFVLAVPVKQSDTPQADFKPLLLKSLSETSHEYVIFAVDDIVVQDHIDLDKCVAALEYTGAYGFYLRLGQNLTYCYTLNKPQQVPPLQEVMDGIYAWTFSTAEHDWAYPNTVDMTVYRKTDIQPDLNALRYIAPNSCEGAWAQMAHRIMDKKGICYAHSKMVNLPLNMVQVEWNNRNEGSSNENSFSAPNLLELFEQGLKMNIEPLQDLQNTSAHMAYTPVFISQ